MPYADKAKQRACEAAYRKRNPDKRKALMARHRRNNLPKAAAQMKKYLIEHPEKYLFMVAKARAKRKCSVYDH